MNQPNSNIHENENNINNDNNFDLLNDESKLSVNSNTKLEISDDVREHRLKFFNKNDNVES